jgi:hypothetical protein
MTRTILVKAFMEGCSLQTLAALLNEDAVDLEHGLRMGLQELRDEAEVILEPPAPAPSGALNHAAALKRSPVRRRVAKHVAEQTDTLANYPSSLHDPRAESQRACYHALKGGPLVMHEIINVTGLDSGATFQALTKLRQKNLAHKQDGWRGAWELTEEVVPS